MGGGGYGGLRFATAAGVAFQYACRARQNITLGGRPTRFCSQRSDISDRRLHACRAAQIMSSAGQVSRPQFFLVHTRPLSILVPLGRLLPPAMQTFPTVSLVCCCCSLDVHATIRRLASWLRASWLAKSMCLLLSRRNLMPAIHQIWFWTLPTRRRCVWSSSSSIGSGSDSDSDSGT